MRRTLCLPVLLTVFSTLAFAESWSGKLIDVACYDKQQSSTGCDATSTTKAFGLDVNGKFLKLDMAGNEKAAKAIQNRADQAADPTKPPSKEVTANVEGTELAGVITTQNVEVK